MTHSDQYFSPSPPTAGIAERLLAGGGAAVAGLLLLLVSLGTALVAAGGIGIIALIYGARRRTLTRRSCWAGAVALLLVLYAGLGGWFVSEMPADTIDNMQAAGANAQQRQSPAVQRMRRFFPPNPMIERQSQRMVQSRAFTVWLAVMMSVTAIVGGALFIGTGVWFTGLLAGFAVLGRWPMPPPRRAPRATAPVYHEPIPLIR